MSTDSSQRRIGLLLAAGRGSRFDPTGYADKLLAIVGGRPTVFHAYASLANAVERVIAVTRPGPRGERVADCLREAGCTVVACAQAEAGMGHSLACAASHAISHSPRTVVVMLGDMPFVRADTIIQVADAVHDTIGIAAPCFKGRRGHPVAFGAAHLPTLSRLAGDRGAADLLGRHPVVLVNVDDAGVLHDVDTPADLERGGSSQQR